MEAHTGDRLLTHGRTVGRPDRVAEIVEVRGPHGTPPYRLRYPDGHESLVYPGPDSVVEQRAGRDIPESG
ncbi:DUF1918 domain-containing protein [Streptomyces sp. AM 2-1-1]|uniref:DUF1918 domain-containing protein n=1 Tax=unclassified Streptomyces TaxID=2593676 RepID=UPI0023B8AEA5|nr:DUF1918 domain-containing protein [Streptomyces sp. AM 2-1-1]WEH42736.1 DUF1918 domain-containing protein [Streptomyces sp. AM 2-1-1]